MLERGEPVDPTASGSAAVSTAGPPDRPRRGRRRSLIPPLLHGLPASAGPGRLLPLPADAGLPGCCSVASTWALAEAPIHRRVAHPVGLAPGSRSCFQCAGTARTRRSAPGDEFPDGDGEAASVDRGGGAGREFHLVLEDRAAPAESERAVEQQRLGDQQADLRAWRTRPSRACRTEEISGYPAVALVGLAHHQAARDAAGGGPHDLAIAAVRRTAGRPRSRRCARPVAPTRRWAARRAPRRPGRWSSATKISSIGRPRPAPRWRPSGHAAGAVQQAGEGAAGSFSSCSSRPTASIEEARSRPAAAGSPVTQGGDAQLEASLGQRRAQSVQVRPLASIALCRVSAKVPVAGTGSGAGLRRRCGPGGRDRRQAADGGHGGGHGGHGAHDAYGFRATDRRQNRSKSKGAAPTGSVNRGRMVRLLFDQPRCPGAAVRVLRAHADTSPPAEFGGIGPATVSWASPSWGVPATTEQTMPSTGRDTSTVVTTNYFHRSCVDLQERETRMQHPAGIGGGPDPRIAKWLL